MDKGGRRFVALTLGQSNAANHVQGRHTSAPGVLYFHDGQCFAAADPLPGASGTGGSVWSRLGDELARSGRYEHIVFAGLAMSSTGIEQWAPGGPQFGRLTAKLAEMREHGLEPTHLLWHQGETDAKQGTSGEVYRQQFLAMVRSLRMRGFRAPMYVATATYCHGRDSDEVRAAQVWLGGAETDLGLRHGPDTDRLRGVPWRYDDCHFSELGAAEHAKLWALVLLAQ